MNEKHTYGVYKTFKHGDCMDSNYIVILETEDEAKQLVEKLELLRADNRRDLVIGGNDGWEWTSRWTYEKVPAPRKLEDYLVELNELLSEFDGIEI